MCYGEFLRKSSPNNYNEFNVIMLTQSHSFLRGLQSQAPGGGDRLVRLQLDPCLTETTILHVSSKISLLLTQCRTYAAK